MKRLLIVLMLLLCVALPALAEETPYRQRVTRPDEMIFSGPGYDEFCVGTVRKAGVYTIVEEVDDGEGHLWGRLKSGAGWIDLTQLQHREDFPMPISANYADDRLMNSGNFEHYLAPDAEYRVKIAFRAAETL